MSSTTEESSSSFNKIKEKKEILERLKPKDTGASLLEVLIDIRDILNTRLK